MNPVPARSPAPTPADAAPGEADDPTECAGSEDQRLDGADLGTALRAAIRVLRAAGVPSPQPDALALAAHLLDVAPGEARRRAIVGAVAPVGYGALVARRAARVPLQHLTGRAPFRGLDLHVGPGVFVPRPETEVLVGAAIAEVTRLALVGTARHPRIVDLCTGSGAIALAVAHEIPCARVWAVELSRDAFGYAQRNVAETGLDVTLLAGDATAPVAALDALDGSIDVVTCNPPYIPVGAIPRDPEVRDYDPPLALYGGSDDGLAIPERLARRAWRLLRPGGLLLMEHADAQGETLPAQLADDGWQEVRDAPDLAGRPRVASARRP